MNGVSLFAGTDGCVAPVLDLERHRNILTIKPGVPLSNMKVFYNLLLRHALAARYQRSAAVHQPMEQILNRHY